MWTALIELVRAAGTWVALLFAKRSGKQEASLEQDAAAKEKTLNGMREANEVLDDVRNLSDAELNDELRG